MKTKILLLLLIPLSSFAFQRSDAQREVEVKAYLDSALSSKDPLEIAEAWYRTAKTDKRKGNILESNTNLYKSISILEAFGPSYELGRCYYWLSINALELHDLKNQKKFLEKALDIFEAADSDWGRMLIYISLSANYSQMLNFTTSGFHYLPDLEKALHYAELSLFYGIKTQAAPAVLDGIKRDIKRIKDLKNGQPNKHYLELISERLKNTPNESDLLQNKLDFASYLTKLNREDEALIYIEECEKVIKSLYPNNSALFKFLSKAYADYYIKTGNYKEGIQHLEKYHEYNNKTLIEDREAAVSRLNIIYETEKNKAELTRKNQEIELNKKNLSLTRRLLGLTGLFLFITGGLCIILYRLNKKNKTICTRNALLVKEQNHRVKNNLQIVSSLLNMQANTVSDERTSAAMEDAQLRIASMVHLHRQLYNTENVANINMSRLITEIIENIIDTYSLNHTETYIEITDIYLEADKAILVGLLINELITNACKYALKNHPAPHLKVSMQESRQDKLELKVKDNGLKKVCLEERNHDSFGSKLIGMMVSQLEGTAKYEYSNGLEFTVSFHK